MSKAQKITYLVTTIWLSVGMLSTGIVQLMQMKEEVDNFTTLGYPTYLMIIIGVWKVLGVVAILIPKFPILKEWAYAGFFFAMSGAILSHIVVDDAAMELFGPALLLVLTTVSWYTRPQSRKPILAHQ